MPMRTRSLLTGLCLFVVFTTGAPGQTRGEHPYEMVWADRTQDARPPLIDFEELSGWTVSCDQAAASIAVSQEQLLWGDHVAKLVYRGTGPQPKVTLRPPTPVTVAGPFDCINLWVYGNNWAWVPDPTTPQVEIRVVLQSAAGAALAVTMDRVRWQEWWLVHRRLSSEQIQALGDRPSVVGIDVVGGGNTSDRTLYFDNLALYRESLPPLEFQPRRDAGDSIAGGADRRHEHRSRHPALSHSRGDYPAGQRDRSVQDDRRPVRTWRVRLPVHGRRW